MKIVCISDTHGLHNELNLSSGDLIIHAGDLTKRGKKEEVINFLNWYSALDFKYKLFIPGNHDFFFEQASGTEIEEIMPANVVCLNDSGIEIEGLKIWGSPIQPWFYDWAFNRKRGDEIRKHWNLIPAETDILVTHGPAYGVLDRTTKGELVGCADLLEKTKSLEPKLHISGHIHEAYGKTAIGGTTFINASVLNVNYQLANVPIEIEL